MSRARQPADEERPLEKWRQGRGGCETFGECFVWWVVHAFRIPGMITGYNRDEAVEIMRDMKIVGL